MSLPPPPTRLETIQALLARSSRSDFPLRRTFVQQGPQDAPRPGPLADFVKHRDERALELYLLAHAEASSEPWDVSHDGAVWARALGLSPATASAAVSKVWARLQDRKLITRARKGRRAAVTLLKEDGSEDPYTLPYLHKEPYFRLDYAYWLDGRELYQTLDLPAKAVLLIGSSQATQPFQLPHERAPKWYGISPDTAQRGLTQLLETGIIELVASYRREPLTARGYVEERRYQLLGPFQQPKAGSGGRNAESAGGAQESKGKSSKGTPAKARSGKSAAHRTGNAGAAKAKRGA